MTLTQGPIAFGPPAGRLLLKTHREGLGRRAGHDLTLEVTRWTGDALVADEAGSSVTVEAEVDSLRVRDGTGGVKPLSDGDRAEVERLMRKILQTARYPTIVFRSTRVIGTLEAFTIEGGLTVLGRTRPVEVRCDGGDGQVRGSLTVRQTRWGIKPHAALFGALKVADDIDVEFALTL